MELHLMYVNVCKWTYHVSFVILTAHCWRFKSCWLLHQVSPLLVDTLKHPRRLDSLRNHHVIITCCSDQRISDTIFWDFLERVFMFFWSRFKQDISGGISHMLGSLSCVKWHRCNLKYLYLKFKDYGDN
jgi:hypothetical protein